MKDLLDDAVVEPSGTCSPTGRAPSGPVGEQPAPPTPAWTRPQRLHLAALVAASALIIGVRLDLPNRLYFDEVHYVPDAQEIWARGAEFERLAHPPWGKILIGLGIEIFGDNPVGWRIVPATCGLVIIVCTYFATRSLTGRHSIGLFAAGLTMLDGLIITMSRIAMLDIIAAAHVLVAFVLVIEQRRVRGAPLAFAPFFPAVVNRNAHVAAAALLGAAVATKWSALPALIAIGVLAIAYEVLQSRPGERRRTFVRRTTVFVVVPALVYIAGHGAWLVNYSATDTAAERCTVEPCRVNLRELAAGFIREQTSKIEFQQVLIISHPDRSDAIGWPVSVRPVLLYNEACGNYSSCSDSPGKVARISAIGNPVLWAASIIAVAIVAAGIVRRRSWATAAPLVMVGAQWLPWIASPNPGFLFYMTPVVPFMAMVVGIAMCSVCNARVQRVAMIGVAVAAAAAFCFYLPIWTAIPIDSRSLDMRLFLDAWR